MKFKPVQYLLAGAGLILAGLVMLGVYTRQEIFFKRGADRRQIFVEIEPGMRTAEISQLLKQKGLIRNPHLFLLYAGWKKNTLKAGLYYFSFNQTLAEIADILSQGEVSEKKITLIEGWRREQIAQYLAENNIVGYEDFMAASEGLEGRLFPDTYRISAGAGSQEIVKKMTDNYAAKIKDLNISDQDLIVASIVEREAKQEEDWKNIAGVYINRLRVGMFLEADPTIQYGRDNLAGKAKDFDYWGKITEPDYRGVKSDYNTYLNAGLPPGPICNPGLKALEAVKNPTQHNYFYFFHLGDGRAIFSQNLAEHNANKLKYISER